MSEPQDGPEPFPLECSAPQGFERCDAEAVADLPALLAENAELRETLAMEAVVAQENNETYFRMDETIHALTAERDEMAERFYANHNAALDFQAKAARLTALATELARALRISAELQSSIQSWSVTQDAAALQEAIANASRYAFGRVNGELLARPDVRALLDTDTAGGSDDDG